MSLLKSSSFVDILKRIATEQKTVYAWGMFGSVITKETVAAKAKQYPKWYTKNKIASVFTPIYRNGALVWGFDCVGLIKAVLWGWNGDTGKTYGGAIYASGGIPDLSADKMIGVCSGVNGDFSDISVGEFLWMKGHCGIYIGNGKVVESTPKWNNGVQVTPLSARRWLKHGKLPYVEYEGKGTAEEANTIVLIRLSELRKGSTGREVKTLQRLLKALGYKGSDGKVLAIDGDFGANTDYALRTFQENKRLSVDGVCGKNTWNMLLK